MSEAILIAVVTGVITAAVNWGIVKVQLDWLRRDVDAAHKRLDELARCGPTRISGRASARDALPG